MVYPVLFLVRRIAFVLAVLTLGEYVLAQILIQLYLAVTVAGYLLHFKPLDSSFKNRIEVFNECFAMLTNYTLLYFTNFVTEVETRSQYSYSFIACLGISFLVHMIFLIASNIKSAKLSCKKCSNKRKAKKIMDEKNALQAQKDAEASNSGPHSFPFVVDEMGNKYFLHPDCKCTLGCTLSKIEQ